MPFFPNVNILSILIPQPSFSSFPMKSLSSFIFYTQPFHFPTFHSCFLLLLSSFLISQTLLPLVSPIIFPPSLFSLSHSGFPGGISSFTFLVQVMGGGGMACAYMWSWTHRHVSDGDETLQILLSPPCLHLPPAEGMASFRKVSALSLLSLQD